MFSEFDVKHCTFENRFNEYMHERENADVLFKLDEVLQKL